MSTNPEVERRRVLLERVLDVESYWVAVARGGPYTEENRRKGERKLAVLIASLEGDESNRGVSDALADLPGVFAQNIGRGCSLLREVRISIRLDLDATTERLGLPRIPPAQVMTSDGKKIGRNTPCPCGSGKKFKRCCLLKKSKVN